jgi:hypothetical protein
VLRWRPWLRRPSARAESSPADSNRQPRGRRNSCSWRHPSRAGIQPYMVPFGLIPPLPPARPVSRERHRSVRPTQRRALAQPRISIGTGRSISLSAMRTLFVSRLSECWEGTPHRRVSDRRPGENAVRPCRRGHQQRWQPGHRGRIYLRASLRVFQRWKRTRVHRSQVSDQKGSAYGFALGDVNGDTFIDIALARSDAPNVLYLSGK